MGRRPRILVPGGIYHVYNRVSRGQHVFRKDEEAERLEGLFATTKQRDDFQILAWCVMSSHYHLAVRMGEIGLSRSMRTIHHRFSQSYNGRHRVFGPFWQGRYRSKLVDDDEYLRQLITYIHLNPVAAGIVKDASKYRWCGHREVVGRAVGRHLVDVDETLLAFHSNRRSALGGYRSAMAFALGEDWRTEGPGRLPWWRIGRPPRGDDASETVVDEKLPRIQMDGRSNLKPRPKMELDQFLELGAAACEVEVADLSSRKRRVPVVEAREILAWLGVELYGYTVKAMAAKFEKHREAVSRMVIRAAERRVVDQGFAGRVRCVDSLIAKEE